MNITIFSKNRAAQLDSFLKSMKEFFKEYSDNKINILYTYTNKDFEKGYDKIKELHPEVSLIKENNFKKNLLNLINPKNNYTVFFVDDIIWKDYFSLNDYEFKKFEEDDDILTLSLRLNPNMNYCYTANLPMKLPKSYNNGIWNWKASTADFGYPMSVDGHIFRTKDILPLLKQLPYQNPNSLEYLMSVNPINKPKIICYKESKIINIPCNKVQTNNPNKYGDVSIEYLNKMFLNDNFIDFLEYKKLNNKQCHLELPLKFKK